MEERTLSPAQYEEKLRLAQERMSRLARYNADAQKELEKLRNMYDELQTQAEQTRVQLDAANVALNAASEDCHPAIEHYFEKWPVADEDRP